MGHWTEYEIVAKRRTLRKEKDVDLETFHTRRNLEVEGMLVVWVFLATTKVNASEDLQNGFWITRENVPVSTSQCSMVSRVQ